MSIELLGISGGERLGEADPSEKRRVVEGGGGGGFVREALNQEKRRSVEGGFVGRNESMVFI